MHYLNFAKLFELLIEIKRILKKSLNNSFENTIAIFNASIERKYYYDDTNY